MWVSYKNLSLLPAEMYSSVEFAVPLAVGLVSFFVVERILSAIIGLFYYSGTGVKQAMS